MARTAIATLQSVWDCRWSRPGHRLTGVTEALQPESRWVCVREGDRRNLTADECQTCAHWETDGHAATAPATIAEAGPAAVPNSGAGRIVDRVMRATMLLTAALFAVCGFQALTGAFMIPVSVSLWAGTAVLVGLAAFGRFDGYGPLLPPIH